MSVGPLVVGDHFGDSWYGLGFSIFRSTDPYIWQGAWVGKKQKKVCEGGSPLSLLDSLARKEWSDF